MPRAGLDAEAVVTAAATLADADGLSQLTLAKLAVDSGSAPRRCTPTSTVSMTCAPGWGRAARVS